MVAADGSWDASVGNKNSFLPVTFSPVALDHVAVQRANPATQNSRGPFKR